MLSFMIFKLYIYLIFYTYDGVSCNIRYFRIFQLLCDESNANDFANIFSNFYIAELQLEKQEECPYICRF